MILNFVPFFDEIPVSTHNSPRWDAALLVGLYCLSMPHTKIKSNRVRLCTYVSKTVSVCAYWSLCAN